MLRVRVGMAVVGASVVVGCGADGLTDGEALGSSAQALGAASYTAALFLNTSTNLDSTDTADWDSCRGKATCQDGAAVTGMSEIPGGYGRRALCTGTNLQNFTGNVVAKLTLDSNKDQRRSTRLGDWAPGYYKLECGVGEYVRAVSENAAGCQGNNRFHAVQCATGTGLNATCSVRTFDATNDRGTTASGDWDPGAYKGECALNEYVAGVSIHPTTRRPHSLLCCAAPTPVSGSYFAPPTKPTADNRVTWTPEDVTGETLINGLPAVPNKPGVRYTLPNLGVDGDFPTIWDWALGPVRSDPHQWSPASSYYNSAQYMKRNLYGELALNCGGNYEDPGDTPPQMENVSWGCSQQWSYVDRWGSGPVKDTFHNQASTRFPEYDWKKGRLDRVTIYYTSSVALYHELTLNDCVTWCDAEGEDAVETNVLAWLGRPGDNRPLLNATVNSTTGWQTSYEFAEGDPGVINDAIASGATGPGPTFVTLAKEAATCGLDYFFPELNLGCIVAPKEVVGADIIGNYYRTKSERFTGSIELTPEEYWSRVVRPDGNQCSLGGHLEVTYANRNRHQLRYEVGDEDWGAAEFLIATGFAVQYHYTAGAPTNLPCNVDTAPAPGVPITPPPGGTPGTYK